MVRKPDANQRGFDFLPERDVKSTHEAKMRCKGPVCTRKSTDGLMHTLDSFPKIRVAKGAWCKTCMLEAKDREILSINIDQWNEVLARQHGVCAVCKESSTNQQPFAIDYSYTRKLFRGLLCLDCFAKWTIFDEIIDDSNWIEKAMTYRGGYVT